MPSVVTQFAESDQQRPQTPRSNRGTRLLNVLAISNLFPNRREPQKATFNRQQFEALAKLCDVRVVAPLTYGRFSRSKVPDHEVIAGLSVEHPRYLVIPKVLRSTHRLTYYHGVRRTVERLRDQKDFDVILATWAYPDVCASARLARKLGKPFVAKVHGTDLNVGLRYAGRRKQIVAAMRDAAHVITVSSPLRDKLMQIGVDPERISVVPNGVDSKLFKPVDKSKARKVLSLDSSRKHIVYVGNLVPIKGVDVLIRAMRDLDESICLHIIGDGHLRDRLYRKTGDLCVRSRVFFHGRRKHREIPMWLNAADVLCLPSRNEGSPNIVVEAIACGTPVVASAVGGVPDVVTSDDLGLLVTPDDYTELTQALEAVLDRRHSRFEPDSGWQRDHSWQANARIVKRILVRSL